MRANKTLDEAHNMARQPIPRVSEGRRKRVFKEVFTNVPSTVDTSKSAAGQLAQKRAIALSKLRRGKKA